MALLRRHRCFENPYNGMMGGGSRGKAGPETSGVRLCICDVSDDPSEEGGWAPKYKVPMFNMVSKSTLPWHIRSSSCCLLRGGIQCRTPSNPLSMRRANGSQGRCALVGLKTWGSGFCIPLIPGKTMRHGPTAITFPSSKSRWLGEAKVMK